MKVLLFKSIQELITNVGKHAGANHVQVATTWTSDRIEVTIEDDGKGFDEKVARARIHGDHGFGLFSIRERVAYVGGEMTVESSCGKGTVVRMSVPLQNEEGS
jgi:signal transduction histidine kinase